MSSTPKETCLTSLYQRILSLDIAPGADLDEARLCAEYGISRTPLREVLQRLSGEGYIQITENRGAKVASMDLITMRTFFQTAPLIYASVSRLAAENRTLAQIETLKSVQQGFARATGDGQASEAALFNHQFHALIGDMAANPYLKPSLERMLIDHTRLSQTFYRPTSQAERELVARASAQHDALISAIEDQDPGLAVDLTLKHWDLSRDRLERFVRPDPLSMDLMKGQSNAV